MKEIEGGPAFSRSYFEGENLIDQGADGMSLRDYFAAKALQGLLSNPQLVLAPTGARRDWIATSAWALADNMLRARDA